ncbi:UPF0481 protein At3g47200-like isoform X1 [Alnus glutinosa]|uniref:UPF0481 protein At3g47200-like isoform X1 n=1 Tax=Alnus glutinosa TaxID=3517 RepID=UPI002D7877FC|nr:UPF0481 protein At3g47200-like isoform X1 [Alnus glutinosa]XP_062177573.1 UPF0481 protein At3g47200-like isoform X1 [Alnus glutinosa]
MGEYQRETLVYNITSKLESLEPLSSPEPYIYKVPDPLRKLNKEAFSPQILSIGPFHHGDEKLQNMEKHKLRYLKVLMEQAHKTLEDLLPVIEDLEESVRQCYAETISLNRYDFLEMILVDASFIVVLFYRISLRGAAKWTNDDKILLKPWLVATIQRDLMLLENQLPFFIIKKLFDHTLASQRGLPSFTKLTFNYFKSFNTQNLPSDPEPSILHFVDLLRRFFLPISHSPLERIDEEVKHVYSATQLDGKGLKFMADHSTETEHSLLDLDLDYKKGVLKIPHITLNDITEFYARNLIAFEQCHYPKDARVTDYFILLDFLIKSEKDVDLLGRKGIMVNGLGNNDATFINNLVTNIAYSDMNTKYYEICIQLKKFYEDPKHGWLASLRRDYFGNPWKATSTTAVVILLILTLIQAVCSIISIS